MVDCIYLISSDGLLNEFAMMWSIREAFPLHHIVFKQTASHLAHEAFVEQIFSRAGLLSDPNLDPAHLVTLVKVGFNKAACNPQSQQSWTSITRCSVATPRPRTKLQLGRLGAQVPLSWMRMMIEG